jgi:hypothetical protein
MPIGAGGQAGSVGLFVALNKGRSGGRNEVCGFVSASHVVDWNGTATRGKPVFCPGAPYAYRRIKNQIGIIEDSISLVPSDSRNPVSNEADVALVEMVRQTESVSNYVPDPRDIRAPYITIKTIIQEAHIKEFIGREVFKCGAGSGFTVGVLVDVALNRFVRMPYNDNGEYFMTGCLIVRSKPGQSGFSQPGDSGAVVYDESGSALGFVVGGSKLETILHPAERCLHAMDATVWIPRKEEMEGIGDSQSF